MSRTQTPWGPSQHHHEHAPGIDVYSTASHGGARLSAERQAVIGELFPTWGSFLGGLVWLEEDCDIAILPVAFPADYTDEAIFRAERMIRSMAGWTSDNNTRRNGWGDVLAWIDSEAGQEIRRRAAVHESKTADLWERGGLGTTPYRRPGAPGWRVYFNRGNERRVVAMEYPEKAYYSTDELDELDRKAAAAVGLEVV
jgi:hypothetical protein